MTDRRHLVTASLATMLDKVEVGHDDGHWLWTGYRTADGYPQYSFLRMHRWFYELWRGPIPDGLQIDHLCRVRHCVNPWHLEPVTARENLMRGETLAAENAAKRFCSNGHEYTPENTYVRPDRGTRQCRECQRDRDRKRAAACQPM